MSERTIKVPEGMIHAAMKPLGWHPDRYSSRTGAFKEGISVRDILEGALLWLDNELQLLAIDGADRLSCDTIDEIRRMFLAPEPEQSVSLRPGKYIVEVGGGLDPRVTPYEYAPVAIPDEFMECDSCRAKPGSPPLCAGCLHNRQAIENLRKASR